MGIRVEFEIDAERSRVWEQLADLSSHPHWMTDALSIEFMGSQTSGVGTRMRVPTRVGPLRTTDVMEIVEWNAPHSMGVHHRGLVSGKGRFRLEGNSPTTLIWEESLTFPWWLGGRITAMIAGPVLRRIWRANLGRFALIVEG